ncbi:MAG: hypothetical protein ACRCZB_03875 [Bacteroidales bacterium]
MSTSYLFDGVYKAHTFAQNNDFTHFQVGWVGFQNERLNFIIKRIMARCVFCCTKQVLQQKTSPLAGGKTAPKSLFLGGGLRF